MKYTLFNAKDLKDFASELTNGLSSKKILSKSYSALPSGSDLSEHAPLFGEYTLKALTLKGSGQIEFMLGVDFKHDGMEASAFAYYNIVGNSVKIVSGKYSVVAVNKITGEGIQYVRNLTAPELYNSVIPSTSPAMQTSLALSLQVFIECENQLKELVDSGKVIPLNYEYPTNVAQGISKRFATFLTKYSMTYGLDIQGGKIAVETSRTNAGNFEIALNCYDAIHNVGVTMVSKNRIKNDRPEVKRTGYDISFRSDNSTLASRAIRVEVQQGTPMVILAQGKYNPVYLRALTIADQVMFGIEQEFAKIYTS